MISIAISFPYIFMTDYVKDPDQCQLNTTVFDLIYILMMNVLFIFMPTLALMILYILMVVKLSKQNRLIKIQENLLIRNETERRKSRNTEMSFKNNSFKVFKQRMHKDNELLKEMSSYKSKIRIILKTSLKGFAFFCCHMPVKIFLFWSYINHYINPISLNEQDSSNDLKIKIADFLSNAATLIYFLHCISNPIIYNFSSIKFRNTLLRIIVSLRNQEYSYSSQEFSAL